MVADRYVFNGKRGRPSMNPQMVLNRLEELVGDGPAGFLVSETSIAEVLGCHPATVRVMFRKLEADGQIKTSRAGRGGMFVEVL